MVYVVMVLCQLLCGNEERLPLPKNRKEILYHTRPKSQIIPYFRHQEAGWLCLVRLCRCHP